MASLKKRGGRYYVQYYVGKLQKRVSLDTDSLQIAKEKLRKLETSLASGDANPLPSKTPIAEVVTRYVQRIRTIKTPKSAQTDIYYLRSAFGPICDALKITSRRLTSKAMKRPVGDGFDKRCKLQPITRVYLEDVTTADVAAFIDSQVRSRGLAHKTANRYREILCRLFNWAMDQGGVRMPGDRNPVEKVDRYKEPAPEIRFLTRPQIEEQLAALADYPQLQVMVAMYIYAGLRREEALWLTTEDIDFDTGPNGMIRVRAKTIAGQKWESKTKVNRAVAISKALRSYLDRYTPRHSDGNWFFPSPKGMRYDPDNFSQELAVAQKKANLPWTCLDFRHTFGSHLAMKGESLYKISTLMGNSPEICRRHYAALIPEALADTVEFGEEPSPRAEQKSGSPSLRLVLPEPKRGISREARRELRKAL